MKRFLLIIIAFALVLSSCTRERPSPTDILRFICDAETGLPSGAIYSTDAEANSPQFLRPELLATAYGIPLNYGMIESAAIWMSGYLHPCEFAVFLCKSSNAVEDVALFCKQRIKDLNKNALYASSLCGMSMDEYKEYVSGAAVTVSGRYVSLIISSDPKTARRAFLKGI